MTDLRLPAPYLLEWPPELASVTDKRPAGAGHDAHARSARHRRFHTRCGNRPCESASRSLTRRACDSRAGGDHPPARQSPRSSGHGHRREVGASPVRPSVPEGLDTYPSLRLSSGQVFLKGTILKRLAPCFAEPLDVCGVLHPFEQILVRLDGNNDGDGFPVAGDDLGFGKWCLHVRQHTLPVMSRQDALHGLVHEHPALSLGAGRSGHTNKPKRGRKQ